MKKVVGVKFLTGNKVYYFDPERFELKIGDWVIVKTSLGPEIGRVVLFKEIDSGGFAKELSSIVRLASDEDKKRILDFENEKAEILKICKDRIKKHQLPMHLIDAYPGLEGEKIIFIFSSESRVDFRELVRDLARVFKKQVILRQIGPRDEARFIGGFGRCGRELCCSKFLSNLESVTMDMAKIQRMDTKGSSKISGLCGKLMCCLAYELEQYKELSKKLPPIGQKIKLKEGIGEVVDQNVLKQTILLELEDSRARIEVPISSLPK